MLSNKLEVSESFLLPKMLSPRNESLTFPEIPMRRKPLIGRTSLASKLPWLKNIAAVNDDFQLLSLQEKVSA